MRLLVPLFLGSMLSSGILLRAATATLSLGNASGARNQNVSLPITFVASGNPTSALEWDLTYSTTDFSAVNVSVGPSGTAASKNLMCGSPSAGRYNCVLYGYNRNLLADGVVATAMLTVSNTTTNSFSTVSMTSLGSNASGA